MSASTENASPERASQESSLPENGNQVTPCPEVLRALTERLVAGEPLRAALRDWRPGTPLWLGGVRDSVRGLAAATLVEAARLPVLLVVVPETADADIVASDMAAFGVPDAGLLPLSPSLSDPRSLRDTGVGERLNALQRLRRAEGVVVAGGDTASDSAVGTANMAPVVVCASVAAAIQAVPSRASVEAMGRSLRIGQRIDVEDWLQWLATAGFASTTAVELPGEFCQRGGILDVYPADHPQPLRIELFDDEVESIRRFDPASQRSTERLDVAEIAAVGTNTPESGGLAEYLSAAAGVLVVEPARCQQTAERLRARVDDPERFAEWHTFLASLTEHRIALATDILEGDAEPACSLPTATVESFTGELDQIRARVDTIAAAHQVIVVADTPADAERMSELLRETQAATHGRLKIAVADLSGGFRLTEALGTWAGGKLSGAAGVLVLTGAELFHRSPVRRVRSRGKGKPIDNWQQLEAGDLVVHLSHGIGLYRGMELVEKNGQPQEHLVVEFDGGTKIYVPTHRISLLQRYVGGGSSRPRLAKIGGQRWANSRRAVQQAVSDMASELLDVQAERQTRKGVSLAKSSPWQHQFDASFPYTETDDQLAAIEASKEDLAMPRPMDRLICGDVGFGKTEVAMRAAFQAIDNGYQVAVLVPTTVLAEQHYHTFRQRMAEFPVDIGRLNRFAEREEEKETLSKIRRGQIDIVIGTHRIASKQVEFFNLGLVIIDEEHRFGVAIKERLKAKHANVDVLTLSATPIPRTLHMALVGVRDISNLETPPAERLSVDTQVVRWDDQMIRHAIVRELNRGGQVYFVHNRVADIEKLATRLRQIVPEARIGIGHGQMDQGELEKVMVAFVNREYDVLLATTIIENGLDIPNANTIFVDEANRYGLADLHQLRGRVGRYKHQAYCYMLVDPNQYLTPEASKRLRAIEEFSQMGAGFAISMRDLEIRGAGNLLGTQQSGHIAAVGYELYCQLLEDAVRRAQSLPPRLTTAVDLDLPVSAFLPSEYVPDMRHKIDLYRRIAKLDAYPDIEGIRQEMEDRFGPLPRPAERLLELAELRLDAAIWQLDAIQLEKSFLVLRYQDVGRLEHLKRASPLPVRIVDERRAYVPVEAIMSEVLEDESVAGAGGRQAVAGKWTEEQLFNGGDVWLEALKTLLRSL